MPLNSDVFLVPPGYNAAQRVQITQGDRVGKGVFVSWVSPGEPGSSTVLYWVENIELKSSAQGIVLTYKSWDWEYLKSWFRTPGVGPDVPRTFGLIGDLGQTQDSNRPLSHYELNPAKGQTLLFLGDPSYSDAYLFHDNNRWDTWGRFIERNAALSTVDLDSRKS
ncbi:hypothetical protein TIFTF001_005435 [Ficus carica]|uniref:Uncharacterized protein n=1 Tax=Ficus carica TaxID=3494 RepID=A0AA88DEQ1_FICCA|nr:hypothetical protein TIFTF001_005435 [Ficus carica]